MKFAINNVDIRDGRITYRNGKSGLEYVVLVKRFDGSARNSERPLNVVLEGSYDGKPFGIKGNLIPLASLTDTGRSWPFSLTASVADTNVSLAGSTPSI